jgi:hypothetical protein
MKCAKRCGRHRFAARIEDGRIRFWGEIELPGEDAPRILRVITLEDGETIHNAFIDRNFRKDEAS